MPDAQQKITFAEMRAAGLRGVLGLQDYKRGHGSGSRQINGQKRGALRETRGGRRADTIQKAVALALIAPGALSMARAWLLRAFRGFRP
ncbi:hypothetical protein [Bradyrhizobium sp. HKCCYLRH1034]|uniref:hypothetical protein n=1 Tax=Bradyrhizobium sp. HKCCYLRH1034 TaxID=3420751 RepID=UPI003EBB8CB4